MRKLIQSGDVGPCAQCGAPIRQATYEGGQPRWNTVDLATGRDRPGGHHVTCKPVTRH